MLIGKKVKELREAAKMSLTELSQQSGVQIATLSRIENEKMTGTVESHLAVAKALGVDITQLYRDIEVPQSPPRPITEKTATESFTYNAKASYEILANNVFAKRMMPVVLRIEKGGQTNPEQNAPGSEKFVFVLSGEIAAHVGSNTYPLKANNTLYFDAFQRHYFVNKGKIAAKMIVVATPVTL